MSCPPFNIAPITNIWERKNINISEKKIYEHFPKRYSKQKRINVIFECRWYVLHFLLVAGPQLNAVVLQGSARFAQGSRKVLIVQLGRCQKPESRWFWQTRGRIARKLAQAHAQAHAQAAFQSHHVPIRNHMSFLTLNTTLLWATLFWAATFLSFSSLSSASSTSCTYVPPAQKRTAQATLIGFEIKEELLMRHMHQKCIE